MTRPILYSFRRCPYALRSRLAIYRSDKMVELREVVLRDKPAEMIAVSPKATVPVLVFPDGTVLEESYDIMQWAWPHRLPTVMQELIHLFDGAFKHHLDRYKYASRYAGADPTEHRDEAVAILSQLPLRADWLAGADPGFVDFALLPFIRQFRIADPDWFDHDLPMVGVRDWLHRFLVLPELDACMKKYPAWQADRLGILFPNKMSGEPL